MVEVAPIVSVVVPLYNTEAYIEVALQSVRAQTFTDWEVIVVDDCSSDAGPSIAGRIAQSDARIRVVRQENRGLAGARNTGIRQARGRYIALLDADDAWRPTKLEQHVRHLDANPDVGVCYSGSRFIDEAGSTLNVSQRPRLFGITADHVLCRNPVGNGSAAVLRHSMLDEIAFEIDATEGRRTCWFDESFRQSEDIELWTRIAASTQWRFSGVDGDLTLYRISSGGLSANVERQLESWCRMRDKLATIAPKLVATWGAVAEAYQYRYLARRAVMNGSGAQTFRLIARALALHPGMIREEPLRTAQTAALGTAALLLPATAFAALKHAMLDPK